MTRILVLADLGQANYHVGDEAMGIAAAAEMKRRGFEVYLATRDLKHSEELIGGADGYIKSLEVPEWPVDRERLLEEVRAHLDGGHASADIINFVRDVSKMDGILIAGGGNMNSTYGWLLYQRAAFGLVAQAHDIPLVISSQSYGPVWTEQDAGILTELLDSAQLVGSREISSHTWALENGIDSKYCLDDATFYQPVGRTLPGGDVPDLPERYMSVTVVDVAEPEARRIAQILDGVYEEFGLRSVFLPHKGSPFKEDGDNVTHRLIAGFMTSEPIVVPILHTDTTVEVHRGAYVAFANRYHPGVFSLSAGVPTVELLPDAFTDMRVRGMMAHYGAQDYALAQSLLSTDAPREALREIIEKRDEISVKLLQRTEELKSFSDAWWAAIEAYLKGEKPQFLPTLTDPEPFTTGTWNQQNLAERDQLAATSLTEAQKTADENRAWTWGYRYQEQRNRMEPVADEDRQLAQDLESAPVASVVIPTFNAAHMISDQLECLARQVKAPAFEVIVSNNGSTDDLAEVVATFEDRLNVRVIDSSQIQNVSHARNAGILAATTEYILICDADDFVCEDWVRSMHRTLRENPNSYVLGQYLYVTDDGNLSFDHPEVQQIFTQPKWQDTFIQASDPQARIDHHFFIGGASFGIRKSDVVKLKGFDSSYKRGSDDWDLLARAREAGLQQIESYGAAVAYRVTDDPQRQFTRNRFYGLNDVLVKMRYPAQIPNDAELWPQLQVLVKTPRRLLKYKDAKSRLKTYTEFGYAVGIVQGYLKYKVLRRLPKPILMDEQDL